MRQPIALPQFSPHMPVGAGALNALRANMEFVSGAGQRANFPWQWMTIDDERYVYNYHRYLEFFLPSGMTQNADLMINDILALSFITDGVYIIDLYPGGNTQPYGTSVSQPYRVKFTNGECLCRSMKERKTDTGNYYELPYATPAFTISAEIDPDDLNELSGNYKWLCDNYVRQPWTIFNAKWVPDADEGDAEWWWRFTHASRYLHLRGHLYAAGDEEGDQEVVVYLNAEDPGNILYQFAIHPIKGVYALHFSLDIDGDPDTGIRDNHTNTHHIPGTGAGSEDPGEGGFPDPLPEALLDAITKGSEYNILTKFNGSGSAHLNLLGETDDRDSWDF